jgi:DNA polymerase elongation subunit (family B)
MYQAIYYDYKTRNCYLRDDKEGWLDFKFRPTLYRRVKHQTDTSLPILTGGWAEPTTDYDYDDPDLLEKDIDKELHVLRDLYYENEESVPEWHNIVYLDIEIEMGGALTMDYIRQAPSKLTSISIIDTTAKQKYCFIVDTAGELSEAEVNNTFIVPCKSEKELIVRFLKQWKVSDPTIVSTWNGEYFDIPYLYNRIRTVMGLQYVNMLSPIGIVDYRERPEVNAFQIKIAGVNHLDYILLHKKYITKEEPSYKLGEIGLKYAELGKIEYTGNLNTLFKDDINKFIEYNVRDVEIIEALETNLQFINLTVLISHICNIPYGAIYYQTYLGEGALLKYLKQEKIVSPNKPSNTNPNLIDPGRYAGGYLLDPIPGLYFDVIDLDFTSLYPSIAKTLNISIETVIGRIKCNNFLYEENLTLDTIKKKDSNEIITIELFDRINYKLKEKELTVGKFIEILETNKFSLSACGVIFDTRMDSSAKIVLQKWFDKREHYRGLMKDAGKKGDKFHSRLYKNYQQAFKILQNGLYGCYAKPTWRYADGYKMCSTSHTTTGRRLTQESIKFVNNKINDELTTQGVNYITASDTDSMYIQVGKIVDKRFGKGIVDEDRINKIVEIATEIQDESNTNLDILTRELFNVEGKHFFQLKQEVVLKSALWTGKRRYAMYVVYDQGVRKDEMDFKGLELMKSNMNKMFKKFGESLIKDILFGKTKQEINEQILTFYKSLADKDIREVAKPIGLNKLNDYIERPATPSEIFSKYKLGTPAHVKAALRYNDLLKFKGHDKKYPSLILGDKIFYANLVDNPYKIETIAIPNDKVPPEIETFIKTYIDTAEIFESLLLNKLNGLFEDLKWGQVTLNPKVSKFFVF